MPLASGASSSETTPKRLWQGSRGYSTVTCAFCDRKLVIAAEQQVRGVTYVY